MRAAASPTFRSAWDALLRKATVQEFGRSPVVPIDLARVRLLDGPFREAQLRDVNYLVELSADRFLCKFLSNAGLSPKGDAYGGWERQGVAGQTLGHYLSACALMSAATGDERLRARANYIVSELARCQRSIGTGFVGAIPEWQGHFLELKSRGGKMTGWVPWYTLHKTLAGLRDAYLHCNDDVALEVLIKLCAWIESVVAPLDADEMERMLSTEHGGMNETLADAHLLTGEPRWLDLARRFTHRGVTDPLAQHIDSLDGLHANTQIPKVIGAAKLYAITGEPYFGDVARFFWQSVVEHRTYAIGGNSSREHFVPSAQTKDWLSSATAETCNTYNMLRLTRQLHSLEPQPAHFEFYERALFNHILGSNDPKRGMFSYFGVLRPGHFRIYSDPHDAMWCCVGTGMENPARYNESIYWVEEDGSLRVNLFIASEVSLPELGLVLTQEGDLPADPAVKFRLRFDRASHQRVRLRVPRWADDQFEINLDGSLIATSIDPDGYVTIDRKWPAGVSKVDIRFAPTVKEEPLHGAPDLRAFTFGPVVLAGDCGTDGLDAVEFYQDGHSQDAYRFMPGIAVPPLVGEDAASVARRIVIASRHPLRWKVETGHDPAAPAEIVELMPYSDTHFRRYNVYWHTLTPDAWTKRRVELALETKRDRERLARIVDEVHTGEQQSEIDHELAGEKTEGGATSFGKFRHATDGGWFSYMMAVDPTLRNELVLTFWAGDEGPRTFDVLIDGTRIATHSQQAMENAQTMDAAFAIDEKFTRAKRQLIVRFEAHPGNTAGGFYGVKMMRREKP